MNIKRGALVLNFFGAPSRGKSTLATDVFTRLRKRGVEAELVPEVAKEYVWEGRTKTLKNQIYVWAKQHHRIWRVLDDVRVVVTDSPPLLAVVYDDNKCPHFLNLALEETKKTNMLNYFLKPPPKGVYEASGRRHSETEACEKDREIIQLLYDHALPFRILEWGEDRAGMVEQDVLGRIRL